MRALASVDCTDLCRLGEFLFPLTLLVVAVFAVWVVWWTGPRSPQSRPREVSRRDGPGRADLLFAAQDALLVAFLVRGFTPESQRSLAGSLAFLGRLGDFALFAAAWLGSFLLLLGRRGWRPTTATSFWPGVVVCLATTTGYVGLAYALPAAMTDHAGPCLVRQLASQDYAFVGASLAAFGSLVVRVYAAHLHDRFATKRSWRENVFSTREEL